MFSYTSGTTGDPKGVKLTHKMIISAGYATNVRVGASGGKPLGEEDSYISYLPSAHSFEQAVSGMVFVYGLKVGFFGGNVLKLTEDMQILKPTLFPSVPRLFNKIYGKIQEGIAAKTGAASWLINKGVNSKLYYLKNGQGVHHKVYDKLVFNKMKAMLGGDVRLMITGSAPIAGDVLDFLKIAFCSEICEGYGMTETSAASVITFCNDPQTGIVGGPLQNVKVKLRDLPDMGHLHTNTPPTGEVCFWGPSIMSGYFKNPEKTAEAFSPCGWLLSGDVGQINPNGSIKIVDRAKNIFKLSQGEYIAPEKLENVYIKSSWVAQIWVYGDSLRDHIIAFIVVDPDHTKKWCAANDKTFDDALLKSSEFVTMVFDDLMVQARQNKLNSLEKPKQLTLLKDPWSVENDYLTPTMKMKRNVAKKLLADDITRMYSEPLLKEKR